MKKYWVYFLLVVVAYGLNAIFLITMLNESNYAQIMFGQDTSPMPFEMVAKMLPITVATSVVYPAISLLVIASILLLSTHLFLENKQKFSKLIGVVSLAEIVCLFRQVLMNILIKFGVVTTTTKSIGSVLYLMDDYKLDPWLKAILNSFDLFWFIYVVALILIMSRICKISRKDSSTAVLFSYVPMYVIVILVTAMFSFLKQ